MRKFLTSLGLILSTVLPASAQMNLPQNYNQNVQLSSKFTKTVAFNEAANASLSSVNLLGVVDGPVFRNNADISSLSTGAVSTAFTLPAYSFKSTRKGKAQTFTIKGTTAANANTKVIQFIYGATTVTLLNAAANAKDFFFRIVVTEYGANSQRISVSGYANAAFVNALDATATQTDSAATVVNLNLPTATTSADVVVSEYTAVGESF
jgi:hypothetical protein